MFCLASTWVSYVHECYHTIEFLWNLSCHVNLLDMIWIVLILNLNLHWGLLHLLIFNWSQRYSFLVSSLVICLMTSLLLLITIMLLILMIVFFLTLRIILVILRSLTNFMHLPCNLDLMLLLIWIFILNLRFLNYWDLSYLRVISSGCVLAVKNVVIWSRGLVLLIAILYCSWYFDLFKIFFKLF